MTDSGLESQVTFVVLPALTFSFPSAMLLLLLALATVSSGYRFRLLDYGSATFSQSVCLNATATYDEVLANNTCATPVLLNPIVGYVYTIETPWLVNTSFPGVRFDVSTASCNGPSQNGPADVPYGFAVNLAPSLLGKVRAYSLSISASI